jgi:hypothetical protein
MLLKSTQISKKGDNNSENIYYKYLQEIQDYRSHKTQRTRYYDKQGSNKEPGRTRLWNDYVFLVATRQNTLYSATLFSLKEERNASKIGVSGTTG